jgi:predicted Fe-Mo cluster-binding NifX family protein
VDEAEKKIEKREDVNAPPHQPGLLPGWLHSLGVTMIIAGGMGVRAQDLFVQMNIKVLVGAPSRKPEDLVSAWMDKTLVLGGNVCDH